MTKLLDELLKDEKKINKILYTAGPHWNYKLNKIVSEIKKKGIKNFRGINSGLGTSFADNVVLDIRNELGLKGRIISKILSLPFLKKIFNEQLKVTNRHINSFLRNQALVYQNNEDVQRLINKFNFDNTTDFGCVQYFDYNNKKYSRLYIDMAYRIEKLSKFFDFNKIKTYFEIGGGFGSNIHLLVNNFSNIRKIIYLDIVPNLYVGTEYLRYYFGKHVKDYIALKNLDKISFSKNDELEILCIPPWCIEKIYTEIDHFHNAASFVEMPRDVIKNYVSYINKLKVKDISLISYDWGIKKYAMNPEDLNHFFDNKLNLRSEPHYIKFRKNEIFLTSN